MHEPNLALVIFALPVLLVYIASVWAWVVVVGKAGYSPWLALLGLVPIVNVVAWLWFAYTEWPIQRELRQAKDRLKKQSPEFAWSANPLSS